MNNLDKRIQLVSFASIAQTYEIQNLILGIGYSVCQKSPKLLLDGELQLFDCLNILVFGNDLAPYENIISALSNKSNHQYLAIFCRDCRVWNRDVIRLCADFSAWPCEPREFGARLECLYTHHQAAKDGTTDFESMDEDAWAALNLIGTDPEFMRALHVIKKTARYDSAVLIEGESGTGKELAARAIHYLGSRKNYPFVPVNCGALPDSLLENELFGHEKGAYTDAKHNQIGLIAQAEGGTLFLDEIEALSPKGQISLLRFTEDRTYRPLGSKHTKQANVRIITASNVPLSILAARQEFRQDLFFRLNVMSVRLPPLRERSSDIERLAEYFMERLRVEYQQHDKQLHPGTAAWLNQYDWPGNVRELENFIHRGFLMSDGPLLEIDRDNKIIHSANERRRTPDRRQAINLDIPFKAAKKQVIRQFERRYLSALLAKSNGNITFASELAQKERRALGKLLTKHGLDKNHYCAC